MSTPTRHPIFGKYMCEHGKGSRKTRCRYRATTRLKWKPDGDPRQRSFNEYLCADHADIVEAAIQAREETREPENR